MAEFCADLTLSERVVLRQLYSLTSQKSPTLPSAFKLLVEKVVWWRLALCPSTQYGVKLYPSSRFLWPHGNIFPVFIISRDSEVHSSAEFLAFSVSFLVVYKIDLILLF